MLALTCFQLVRYGRLRFGSNPGQMDALKFAPVLARFTALCEKPESVTKQRTGDDVMARKTAATNGTHRRSPARKLEKGFRAQSPSRGLFASRREGNRCRRCVVARVETGGGYRASPSLARPPKRIRRDHGTEHAPARDEPGGAGLYGLETGLGTFNPLIINHMTLGCGTRLDTLRDAEFQTVGCPLAEGDQCYGKIKAHQVLFSFAKIPVLRRISGFEIPWCSFICRLRSV